MDRTLESSASALVLALGLLACSSLERDIPLEALDAGGAPGLSASGHHGPPVVAGSGGPGRFVEPLYDGYDKNYARELIASSTASTARPGTTATRP